MSRPDDFWSRRKAAVVAEVDAETSALEAEKTARAQASMAEKTDEEILVELDLPDPDTLEAGDDFSAFLKTAVPERLRRRALRRLWLSNPLLANLDELVDYGEDYTDAATVVENLQTTYQVGKGMLKHLLEVEKSEAEAEVEDIASETADAAPADEIALEDRTAEVAFCEPESTPDPDTESGPVADPYADLPAAPSRRRMRFDFANVTT